MTGIEVRNQDGYGIIDARVLYGTDQSSNWTADNPDQTKYCSHRRVNDPIVKVVVKEQGGYGLIDLQFTTRSGYNSGWLVNNPANGIDRVIENRSDCDMVGLQGKEQGTFGLIDLRLAYRKSE